MIKIYKNTMDEEVRLQALELIHSAPDYVWTQSVCTDESVIQLRDAMPWFIMRNLDRLHVKMKPMIEKDFGLEEKGIKLLDPDYADASKSSIITVDKRLPGMSLSPHADIPTGTYERHRGSENGESMITISAIYYWDDQFSGGEIDFHENAIPGHLLEFQGQENDYSVTGSYKPVAGDLLVFPSATVHSIRTIESGERISSQYFFNSE